MFKNKKLLFRQKPRNKRGSFFINIGLKFIIKEKESDKNRVKIKRCLSAIGRKNK